MTRREFIEDTAGTVAGVAFVGCGLLTATTGYAQAPAGAQPQARRREVVVSGRRV